MKSSSTHKLQSSRACCADLIKQGRIDEALEIAKTGHADNRGSTVSSLFLAACLLKQGAVEKGLRHLEAGEEDAALADVLAVSSELVRIKNYEYSLPLLRRAKNFYNTSVELRCLLARSLHLSNERAAAKIEADELRDTMEPTDENFKALLTLYNDLDAKEFARDTAELILLRNPKRFDVRKLLVDVLFELRQTSQIRVHLKSICEREGADADELLFVARVLLRFVERAARDLQIYTKTNQFYIEASEYNTRYRKDDLREALRISRRLVNGSNNPSIAGRVTLVEALIKSSDRGAWGEIKKLQEKCGEAADYASVSELYHQIGRKEDARRAAQEGVRLDQGSLERHALLTRIRLAEALTNCGALDEARRLLIEISINPFPDNLIWRRFHTATFNADLVSLSIESAKQLLRADPGNKFYTERLQLLSMLSRPALVKSEQKIQTQSWFHWFWSKLCR